MYSFTHRVRYHEVDQQGFLFNGRYLEIADVALTEYFRHLGWTYRQLNDSGVDPAVVRAEVSFLSPARFDDDLQVDVECTRVGRTSFGLRTRLRGGQRDIAEILNVYVNVDADTTLPRNLPDEVARALRGASADTKEKEQP